MKKLLLIVQIISALTLLSSKYFLATDNIIGWWFSVTGYLLACFWNVKNNLKIYALLVFSLALLSTYGGYKWATNIEGLEIFDYFVIIGTLIISLLLAKKAQKLNKNMWKYQISGTFLFMFAFILIGFKHSEGWVLMFAGHFLTGYIYLKTRAYAFVIVQILSAYIAASQLIPFLLLPY
jgi:hypothetical protein